MRIALKVDVDTLDGTQNGVPELLRVFDRHRVRGTFLFSLGPDHTGRALRRIFRPGFFKKVRRTSVVSHYGWRTLLYGTLLPGPDIGRRSGDLMRSVAKAGHEVGVHCFDHVRWQDNVAGASKDWTRRQLGLAYDRFREIYGVAPVVHGAAGWQMNAHAYRAEVELGFRYASDTRGSRPYQPAIDGRPTGCLQLPTTLPTLDELIGRDDLPKDGPLATLAAATEHVTPTGHVFTLHAEIEGGQLKGALEELITTWKAQGYALGRLADSVAALDARSILQCHAIYGSVPGRSGTLALQGDEMGSRETTQTT